jgi:hypothetical protein
MTKRTFALALFCVLAIVGSGLAQAPLGTIGIPQPDFATNPNSFSTSLRYDTSGNLYAWDGLNVWAFAAGGGTTQIGSVTAGNSADAGPISFSQDGHTLLLSNGAGGALGGVYNGAFFTMLPTDGTSAPVSGGVPYTGDALALPAASTIPGSSTKYLVYQGSAFTGGPVPVSVSVFDAAAGTNQVIINGEVGATASIAINPTNKRLYVDVGYGSDQGQIYSFSLSQIDSAYTSGTPINFHTGGNLFNPTATGSQNGAGMFFDNNGYLFAGGDGITVFRPNGTICYDQSAGSADGYYDTLTFNPATNEVLKLAPYSTSPSTGALYDAADFEPAFWTKSNGGSWGLSTNWFGKPLTTGAALVFAGSTSGTAVVTLDGNRSASALQFGDSTAAGQYAITSGSTDTLTLGTTASGASISIASGTQMISTPIVLEGDLAVSTSAGTRLDLAGSVNGDTGVSAALYLSGAGQLVLSGTTSLSGVTIAGGTLNLLHPYDLPDGAALTVDSLGAFAAAAVVPSVAPQSVATVPEPSGWAILSATAIVGFMVRRGFRLAPRRQPT